jgi:ankyrin repeat protein
MPIRELPARPNLEHLKNQARTLQRDALASEAEATARFAGCNITAAPKLADALHVIAREYGFETWPALKLHIEVTSADPVEALIAAIKSNDAALVRQVLARHPSLRSSINEPLPNYGFDAPAIFAAVEKQNRDMVDAILDFGANINERTRWWAGSFGVLDQANPELAAYLISRGAAVDIHAAARLNLPDRVRELLASDPQLVHARGGDGQLPLHFAATVEIAAILLDAGAEIDARDIDHESTAAQYMASIQPHRHDVARFLISRGATPDILMASALGDLALVESILNDDPDTIRTTVTERYFPKQDPRSGGSIYIFGFGWTKSPHILARQFEHPEVFALLMQRSPNWLRLINAAEAGDDAYFARILAAQPQLFQKLTSNAARRLMGVSIRNNTHAIHLLLAAGWPANVAMDTGETPLHFAAWHGNIDVVRDLIAHNAPVNVFETGHGGNSLAWALHGSQHSWNRDKGDYPAVTRALLAAGAQIPKPEKPLEATEEVLEIIRQQSKDLSAQGSGG